MLGKFDIYSQSYLLRYIWLFFIYPIFLYLSCCFFSLALIVFQYFFTIFHFLIYVGINIVYYRILIAAWICFWSKNYLVALCQSFILLCLCILYCLYFLMTHDIFCLPCIYLFDFYITVYCVLYCHNFIAFLLGFFFSS